jgi:hypothetical protein
MMEPANKRPAPALSASSAFRFVLTLGHGDLLLAPCHGETARLWDAITGQPVIPPLTHRGWVPFAVFSPVTSATP